MGDRILRGSHGKQTFAVTFEFEIYAENDPYEDCTNYPTESFESYGSCVKELEIFNLKLFKASLILFF